MRTKFLILFLTKFLFFTAYCQEAKINADKKDVIIKGECVNFHSKEKIPERISILVYDSTGKANIKNFISDDNGKFEISLPRINRVFIRFSSINYLDKELFVQIESSDTMYLGKIEMELKSTELPEVTVIASKKLVELSFNKVIYNPGADSLNAGINALEMIEKVPMVDVGNNNQIFVGNSSSYVILINGREKGMLLQNPGSYLKTLPANLVKSVEIVTDPSAKYTSEGIKYIVDIHIEKKLVDGIYGDIGGGISTKQQEGSLFLLLKKGKLGVQINSNYNRFFFTDMRSDYSLSIKNSITSKQETDFNTLSQVFSPGLNITFDVDTTFIISGDLFGTLGKSKTNNNVEVMNMQNGDVLVNRRQTINNIDNGFIFYSLSGEKTLNKKKDLLFVAYRGYYSPGNSSNLFKEFDNDNQLTSSFFNRGKAKMYEHTFQIEYDKKIKKDISLSSGIKNITRNIHAVDYFNNEKDTSSDYAQKITSFFSDFAMTRNKYQFHVSFSLDYSLYKNLSGKEIVNFRKEYFNIFPSVSVSKSLKKKQFISLRFSDYVKRPGLTQISVVTNYSNPESLTQGNIALNPQIVYNTTLEYSKLIKYEPLMFGTFMNISRNEIMSTKKVLNDSTLMSSYSNLGKSFEYGFTFSYRFKIMKKITVGINSTIGSLTIINKSDKKEKQSGVNYSIAPSLTYMIPGKILFGFRNYFYSKVMTYQGYSSGYWDCRITFTKKLLKDVLNTTLMVYNPFLPYQNVKNIYSGELFSERSEVMTPQRYVSLTLHFEFGDYMKSSFRRNKISIKNTDVK